MRRLGSLFQGNSRFLSRMTFADGLFELKLLISCLRSKLVEIPCVNSTFYLQKFSYRKFVYIVLKFRSGKSSTTAENAKKKK